MSGGHIPPKANRRRKNCFSPTLYRSRNAIERILCRLKDFRRVATRYDRLAATCLAAACRAAVRARTSTAAHGPAIVAFWFLVQTLRRV